MDDLNKSEMAQRWAEFVIERWIRKIQALKIGDTGELVKSLRAQVELDANGDPEKITFLYLYYGIFTDMGVGRSVKLGQAGRGNNRTKKPWYSSVFLKQVAILGRKMAERYGYDAASLPLKAFEGASFAYNDDYFRSMNRNG